MSTLEAVMIIAVVGGAALVLVGAFTDVFDGLMDDFNGTFGG